MFLRNYFFPEITTVLQNTLSSLAPLHTSTSHSVWSFYKSCLWTFQMRTASIIFYLPMFNPSIFSSVALQKWVCWAAPTLSLKAHHAKKKTEYKFKAVQTQTLVLKHLHYSFSKNGRVEWTIGNMNYTVHKSGLIDNPFWIAWEIHKSVP